jgi:hypothetical protein
MISMWEIITTGKFILLPCIQISSSTLDKVIQ